MLIDLSLQFWEEHLSSHEDSHFTHLIVKGLKSGFRIGFQRNAIAVRRAKKNMVSAETHPEVVASYLDQELRAGRVALVGTEEAAQQLNVQVSPFGVIPKKGKPNQWQLTLELSLPAGRSVNDRISKEMCGVQYTSVSEVAAEVVKLGRGTLMGKMDIQHTYRNILVAPDDRRLLGMLWQGKVYVNKVLPFGLRSAPLIFSSVADALQWIMIQQGTTWVVHYLDDFTALGPGDSPVCSKNMETMAAVCAEAGLPIEPSKTVGPATMITFLGMELDSLEGVIRLPEDKLRALKDLLQKWRAKMACRKRELLSLLGLLNHACKAVRAGRSFLQGKEIGSLFV